MPCRYEVLPAVPEGWTSPCGVRGSFRLPSTLYRRHHELTRTPNRRPPVEFTVEWRFCGRSRSVACACRCPVTKYEGEMPCLKPFLRSPDSSLPNRFVSEVPFIPAAACISSTYSPSCRRNRYANKAPSVMVTAKTDMRLSSINAINEFDLPQHICWGFTSPR